MVLCDKRTAEDSWLSLKTLCEQLQDTCGQFWDRFPPPFDKKGRTTDSSLTVLECLQGLESAYSLRWLPPIDEFSIREWKLLRQKFDASWLIPGEILALGDPSITAQNPNYPELLDATRRRPTLLESDQESSRDGRQMSGLAVPFKSASAICARENCEDLYRCPSSIVCTDNIKALKDSNFAEFLAQLQIGLLVRLNFSNECAEQSSYQDAFKSCCTRMVSFEFADGTAPPAATTSRFLDAVHEFQQNCHDQGFGPYVAVHCKGGLGRTATLVGAYAMQKYGISAGAFHGWVRICRPGSVQTVEQERYLRKYKTEQDQRNAVSWLRFLTLTLPTLLSMSSISPKRSVFRQGSRSPNSSPCINSSAISSGSVC